MKNLYTQCQTLINYTVICLILVITSSIAGNAQVTNSEHSSTRDIIESKPELYGQPRPIVDKSIEKSGSNIQKQFNLDSLLGNLYDRDFELNPTSEIGAIARLRQRIIRLELEYEIALLEAKIAKIGEENLDEENFDKSHQSTTDSETIPKNLLEPIDLLEQTLSSNEQLPVVAEIVGVSGELTAKILVPYFGEVTAHVGTMLPNGMKISLITLTAVFVTKNDKTQQLPFGNKVPAIKPKE